MSEGLIAIIRGVTPTETVAIGEAIYAGGFRAIEVPLNSPDPLRSIESIRKALPADCRVGAGTVLTVDDVHRPRDVGAEIIVSPNTFEDVIAETVRLGLASYPGAATPSEAFTALRAGAGAIKIFPAETVGIAGMKALASVLPKGTPLLPVGGVDASNLAQWRAAGAAGAGIGSSLYRAGDDPAEVSRRASEMTRAWQEGAER